MPPIGVGEGWTPSKAEALLLELNGNGAHDLPLITKALDAAAGTDTTLIAQLENALRVKSDEFERAAEGLKRLEEGTEVADLRQQLAQRDAALAEAKVSAVTEQAILTVAIQSRDARIAEQDEEIARLKAAQVPEQAPVAAPAPTPSDPSKEPSPAA